MAVIKDEDVLGYLIAEDWICGNCITPEEEKDLTLSDFLIRDGVDADYRYFCGRCQKEIA
jgi:hypothetical protein